MNILLAENRDREARILIDAYPDDRAAAWARSNALLKLKGEGSNEKTDKRPDKTVVSNSFAPPFVLGMGRLPKRIFEAIGMGDESGAVEYVGDSLKREGETSGAPAWTARAAAAYIKRRAKS